MVRVRVRVTDRVTVRIGVEGWGWGHRFRVRVRVRVTVGMGVRVRLRLRVRVRVSVGGYGIHKSKYMHRSVEHPIMHHLAQLYVPRGLGHPRVPRLERIVDLCPSKLTFEMQPAAGARSRTASWSSMVMYGHLWSFVVIIYDQAKCCA